MQCLASSCLAAPESMHSHTMPTSSRHTHLARNCTAVTGAAWSAKVTKQKPLARVHTLTCGTAGTSGDRTQGAQQQHAGAPDVRAASAGSAVTDVASGCWHEQRAQGLATQQERSSQPAASATVAYLGVVSPGHQVRAIRAESRGGHVVVMALLLNHVRLAAPLPHLRRGQGADRAAQHAPKERCGEPCR